MLSKLNDTSIQNDETQLKSNNNNEIKNKIIPAKDLDENSENDEYDDDDDDEDNDVKPVRKAPNELLEEFLVYIMQKNWKDAHKLCKFILIYEPHNQTAKEFLPLIETKLAITESDSSENESDSESDDDDDDIDSDEESDSDSDSDSDTDESDKEKNKKETGLQASNYIFLFFF